MTEPTGHIVPEHIGAFRIGRQIGRGGMGWVYAATSTDTGLPVAIKLLDRRQRSSAASLRAFRREVRAVAGLDDPHVVRVHDQGVVPDGEDSGDFGGSPYLVMERAAGTLRDVPPPRDWETARLLLSQVLGGLAHAHAHGIIHRDLKPGNVLVRRLGVEVPWLRLTDFGLACPARPIEGHELLWAGTPAYMAPEQLASDWRSFGPPTDLYAFGCLAWWLLCGHAPFHDLSMSMMIEAHLKFPLPTLAPRLPVPIGASAWLGGLLARDPLDRYRCAADVMRALDALDPSSSLAPVEPASPADSDMWLTTAAPADDTVAASTTAASPPPAGQHTGASEAHDTAPVDSRPPPFDPEHWRRRQSQPVPLNIGLGLLGMRGVSLVGRETTKAGLWRALGEVIDEGGVRCVTLEGTAGLGKSRLASWLAIEAKATGVAQVVHLEELTSASLMLDLMRRCGCVELPRPRVAQRLRRLAVPDAEFLAGIMTGQQSLPGRALYAVALRTLTALAPNRATIVWVDDRPDDDLSAFISTAHALAGQGEGIPLLMLLPARDASTRLGEHADSATHLPVLPLTDSEQAELIQALLGLDPELARDVEQRAAGRPQFIVQLIGDWSRRGLLEPSDTGYVLRDTGAPFEIPHDLTNLWTEQVERLVGTMSADAQRAIHVAALLGQNIVDIEWARAAHVAGCVADTELVDVLIESGLAADETPHCDWSFITPACREVLVARAARGGQVASLHHACAEALEDLDREKHALRYGMHLLRAGDPRAAREPLLRGAVSLVDLGDLRLAARALSLWETTFGTDEVPTDERLEGWLLECRILAARGDLVTAVERARAVERTAKALGAEGRELAALYQRGRALQSAGHSAEARECLERAELCDDDAVRAACAQDLGWLELEQGHLDAARRAFERALRIQTARGDLRSIALARRSLGVIAQREGHPERATIELRAALDGLTRLGALSLVADCLNSLGELARAQGDLDEAAVYYRKAARSHRLLGSINRAICEANLGLVLIAQGDLRGAGEALENAFAHAGGERRPGIAGAIESFLLACGGVHESWSAWDARFDRAQALLDRTGYVDSDVLAAYEQAAERAAASGHEQRALRASARAADLRSRLLEPSR